MGGPLLLALVTSDWVRAPLRVDLMHRYGIRWTAALGVEAQFLKPFLPGDTLYSEYTLAAVRASTSRPGQAVMEIELGARNQHGDRLLRGRMPVMFERRSETEASEGAEAEYGKGLV